MAQNLKHLTVENKQYIIVPNEFSTQINSLKKRQSVSKTLNYQAYLQQALLEANPCCSKHRILPPSAFLLCLDVLFTLASRSLEEERNEKASQRHRRLPAPIVKGFSAGSGTRSFPEMT